MALAIQVNNLTLQNAHEFAVNALHKIANKATMLQIIKLWDSSAFVAKNDESCSLQ